MHDHNHPNLIRRPGFALLAGGVLMALALETAAQPPAAQAPAEITLIVPAGAEILFDGRSMGRGGSERYCQSPPLVVGRRYTYDVLVRWTADGQAIERRRSVAVTGGAQVRVDFLAAPAGEATGAPQPPDDTRAIAEEAFIYGFPMVMNYATMYEYFIDKASTQYKCPFNQIYNTARVFTPKDTAIVTPNSDTPYSFIGADLRAEPLVISVPEVEKGRYYSVQLIDAYTFTYGYLGSRATGNGAGTFLIAGPGWKGETPAGIKKVIPCETDFSFIGFRTQLFGPADLDKVKQVQAGYKVQTLSQYLQRPAPAAPPEINWPKIDKKAAETDPFAYLNFVLQFCPPTGPAEVEKPLRARFAKIGIAAGQPFPAVALPPAGKAELAQGMKAGYEKIRQRVAALGKDVHGWRVSTEGFGNRADYQGDWLLRAAVAMAGIYGNEPVEALYPLLSTDSEGTKPDCSKNKYTLTFPKGQLPPINAFWSVTMYDGKTQLLIDNPLNRYLINSPMLPDLRTNADGSLTLYLQKDSPGKDKEANWLPAPDGPIFVVMRLYWPKPEALDGTWKPPAVQRIP